MKFGKRLRKYILFLILIIFLAVEVPIFTTGRSTQPLPSDVIIVPGARLFGRQPSAVLRLRLDEAAKLYQAGYAPAIIVSGAKGRDEETSEAEAMREYLIVQGIPAENILTEDASYNTYQNLINSQAIMAEHGFKSALIVSSSPHIRRALFLANQLGMNASCAPAPMPENNFLLVRQYLREGVAMVSLTVFNK
jgi:uncharacterized SAM-binding protein YcdF (DUF218 family)